MDIKLIDCTLRDGGYYNAWEFSPEVIEHYLKAMDAISADYVEIGFRTLNVNGYKGGCGYSTDSYIRSLDVPPGLKLAVMVNAAELVEDPVSALQKLFAPAADSPVSLVRIACHMHEIEQIMPGVSWLKENGYLATINFMQIADRSKKEISKIAELAEKSPLDVLYFADSMGSLNPDQTAEIIKTLRTDWKGEIGIHTHDNMGQGLANTMRAVKEGATWVDGTVTGMGRGPGNAKTEYLTIELEQYRKKPGNPIKLFSVINKYFKPMQVKYEWGPNPFYYLAGKYGIHPTYIQAMIGDNRFNEEDILVVIDYLRKEGGKKFRLADMEAARHFYSDKPSGTWVPANLIAGREVLILGTGPGVVTHQRAIEEFIKSRKPFVIALNTQTSVASELIDIRAACHPVRLLADHYEHTKLPQPLVIPASQLSDSGLSPLSNKQLFDFGLQVQQETFAFKENYCILPSSLVVAYALAIATSGKAMRIFLAGFDGYGAEDPRNIEMDAIMDCYMKNKDAVSVVTITPSKYNVPKSSIYGLL